MWQIKGPGIISARDWLNAKFGPDYHLTLCREVDPSFPERILPGEWYPIDPVIHALRRAADDVDGVSDLEQITELLAMENAKNDLKGVYRAFLWVASPRMFLRAAKTIWANYANVGTVTDPQNDPGRFTVRLTNIPEDYIDWVTGAWKGFLPPAIEMAGGKDATPEILERKPDADHPGNWEVLYQLSYRG